MQKKPTKRLVILIVVLCAVLLVTAGVIFGVMRYLDNWAEDPVVPVEKELLRDYDKILPGISICGIDVSGLTRDEATVLVSAELQSAVDDVTFSVHFPDETLEISGYLSQSVPTLSAAVTEAWQYGRGIVSTLDEATRWTTDHPLSLEPAVKEEVLPDVIRSAVEAHAKTLDARATDCKITEHDEHIEILKGRDGKELDVDKLCREIEKAVKNGQSSIEASYKLSISGERQVKELHERFCTEPADACWDNETQAIRPEQRGQRFDLKQALDALNVPDGSRIVIPIEFIDPEITEATLQEKLFVDEMGQYSSPHTPIAPRTNNLTKACAAIDGTVLNPGDVFSFNEIVGPRSYETGYQDAAIYLNGETTDSVGGGICQVASTIYVCALQANLEIVQRTEHMYFVDYVPEGQDATIYWDGGLDFQFRNSTDYPMRIDASVSGGYVHIALWGTNVDGSYAVVTSETLSVTPWEVVTKEDEEQPPEYEEITTTPYTGYVIRTYRNVYDKDGNLLSREVEAKSTYHKRDQVITIGKQPEEPEEPENPDIVIPGDREDIDWPEGIPKPDYSDDPNTDPDSTTPEDIRIPDFPPAEEEPDNDGFLGRPWYGDND